MRFFLLTVALVVGLLPCYQPGDIRLLQDRVPAELLVQALPSPVVDSLFEKLPSSLAITLETRKRILGTVARPREEMGALIEDATRWEPGSTITVAFLGGNSALHHDIAEATRQLTDNCNLVLDFGYNPATGTYRTWSTNDLVYKADIRVSFDEDYSWSLVGRDSSDPTAGDATAGEGGRPNQRSLNLTRFLANHRPMNWKRTTRHEFMHVLGFQHEHQNPNGTCDSEFRWQNDPGYVLTQDITGAYITDNNGRRPGIYTYMAGAPNHWPQTLVDLNLKPLTAPTLRGGVQIDAASIMLYRFPDLFYQRKNSPCAPTSDGDNLSAGDRDGLHNLYPVALAAVKEQIISQRRLFNRISRSQALSPALKETFRARRESLQ